MSTADDDDYYAVLGCPRSASQDELRRAYHRLARALHPDRRPDAAAHAQMARVGEAWAILKNPRLRAVYDRDGREGVDDLSDAASDDGEAGTTLPAVSSNCLASDVLSVASSCCLAESRAATARPRSCTGVSASAGAAGAKAAPARARKASCIRR